MKFQFIVASILVTFLVGCAKAPTPEQIASADYGQPPENYKEIVSSSLFSYLKDPDSAKINFTTTPTKQHSAYFGPVMFGYGVCTAINAKNSYGGYTGYKKHYFLIKNGVVIQHIGETGETYDLAKGAISTRCP